MGQQKAFASKYELRRLGSTARMWEKEGAEDGAEGFLSRRWGKKHCGQENSLCIGRYRRNKGWQLLKEKTIKRMEMERKQEENGKLCSFFEKPISDGLID